MKAGEVYCFHDFKFKDGSTSDHPTLIIVLNSPQNNDPFLLIQTTSRQHFRKSAPGCHSEENYYYFPQGIDGFHTNTWVLFQVYEISYRVFVQDALQRKQFSIFTLSDQNWRALKNCILKSQDIELEILEKIRAG